MRLRPWAVVCLAAFLGVTALVTLAGIFQAPQAVVLPAPEQATLDINLAGVRAWASLPGIGPVLADRIVALRTARGGFRTIDDLLAVKGIGTKKLARMKKFLSITPPEDRK